MQKAVTENAALGLGHKGGAHRPACHGQGSVQGCDLTQQVHCGDTNHSGDGHALEGDRQPVMVSNPA